MKATRLLLLLALVVSMVRVLWSIGLVERQATRGLQSNAY